MVDDEGRPQDGSERLRVLSPAAAGTSLATALLGAILALLGIVR